MNNHRGLLYSALHKFYNALCSLERFEKGTNFFDNINFLDNFFSEYRNITFVLQKSLAHTTYTRIYEDLRDKFLAGDVIRWFVDKRNEVLKQQPFDLEKKIVINVYSEQGIITLPDKIFTIENDIEYSTIIESLRSMLFDLHQMEVMFSAEFTFTERGQTRDLFDNFIFGINQMKLFLSAMRKAIYDDCKLSDELEKKIEKINFYRVPKNFLFIDDYIFYCKKNSFEKAHRVELLVGTDQTRVSIERLQQIYQGKDVWENFQVMHLVMFQMQKTLLPTCLLLFSDDTFQLLTFGGSLKTTIYRKFHEVAKRIVQEDIISVLFVTEMYGFGVRDVKDLDSRERINHAQMEMLTFFMATKDMTKIQKSYDTSKIDDFEYIASVMFRMEDPCVLPNFYAPILSEFMKLEQKASG